MKYQVTVTQEPTVTDKTHYQDDTIFKQSFEELDLAALAIFLNKGNVIPYGYVKADGTSSEVIVFQE